MKLYIRTALATGALALAAAPATAGAVDYTPAEPKPPKTKPAPPEHAKAHGKRCQGKSKKHVKGEQGTEFSRCVKALAKAEDHPKMHPRKACKGLSKKHEKGEKGTEFSRCVKEVAQLRREERRKAREEAAAA
ncbi:MAG TPA: hypothetical protein VFY04_06750 [Solirubrobacterales bacterium]|nr:hypothetical protein [Solirubrobacterales bacterium]